MNINRNKNSVVIQCTTYNHEPYIRQCLDGFAMQKTKFPFAAIVIDDASTDNEPEVLWDFINNELESKSLHKDETNDYIKIFASHKTNTNCTFVILFLKYNHRNIKKAKLPYYKEWQDTAKYIALCEGDDYWTDPLKLQKQVDILEQKPDVLLVYSAFETVDDKNNIIKRPYFDFIKKKSKSGDVFSSQILMNSVLTLTVCVRKEVLYTPLYINSPFHYDYALSLCASLLGNLFYISDITGCYRKTPGSLIVSYKKGVSRNLKEVNLYFCLAFLKGDGKQRSVIKRIGIFINILRAHLYDKNSLNTILETYPKLKFLLPIAFTTELFNSVKKRI